MRDIREQLEVEGEILGEDLMLDAPPIFAIHTRCTWAGGTCANYPDFFENHQFHVIYCVTLAF